MKTFSRLVAFLLFASGVCQATPEIADLAEKLRAALPMSEWRIATDWHSITLIKTNVQFLNPISLPLLSEGEIWSRYSFTSDYRITVTFATKLTQREYDELVALKRTLTATRMAGLNPSTKDFFGRSKEAQGLIQLPDYCSDRFSVYLYASDDDFFRVRPDTVRTERDKVKAILEKAYLKYSATAEPGAAANSHPPQREQ